ncbi:MAG TPA: diacylglycerol kinase family protein [Lachnospiraceae bacterium]|jgi:diacylglycerol kinase (ATP)|nr:diacylglycerol kinase family protein [Lachnospiraceae bacterium]
MIYIFIINPVAGGKDRSENIRKFLSRKDNFQYLVFDTDGPGQERALVEKMLVLFEDDVVRFFICGGSGTFFNAFSGVRDMSKVEMAMFPCGATNDFLKIFGRSRKHYYNMDNLVRGDTLALDYLKMDNYNATIFISAGITARIEKFVQHIRFLLSINFRVTYIIAFFATFFSNQSIAYQVDIDGEDLSGEYGMVYIGNGIVMGGFYCPFKDALPNDGMMEVLLLKKISKLKFIHFMRLFQHGEIEKFDDSVVIRKAKKITMKRKDEKDIVLNCDGDLICQNKVQCELVERGMNFVVPRGAELYQSMD